VKVGFAARWQLALQSSDLLSRDGSPKFIRGCTNTKATERCKNILATGAKLWLPNSHLSILSLLRNPSEAKQTIDPSNISNSLSLSLSGFF